MHPLEYADRKLHFAFGLVVEVMEKRVPVGVDKGFMAVYKFVQGNSAGRCSKDKTAVSTNSRILGLKLMLAMDIFMTISLKKNDGRRWFYLRGKLLYYFIFPSVNSTADCYIAADDRVK